MFLYPHLAECAECVFYSTTAIAVTAQLREKMEIVKENPKLDPSAKRERRQISTCFSLTNAWQQLDDNFAAHLLNSFA